MRVLLIDNYDSFTSNLVHLVGGSASRSRCAATMRSTSRTRSGAIRTRSCSRGPCTPNEAGICLDLVRAAGESMPVFGVCLGLQTIGQAYGGEIVRAPLPMHGKISTIRHDGRGLLRGINGPFAAARYHSLVIRRETCPEDLVVEATSDDGLIMAASHRNRPVGGVQFHPESIASEHGATILRNFLDQAQARNIRTGRRAPAAA